MAVIPVIPTFPAGTAAGSAALTQCAAAAQWLCYTRPLTQARQAVTQPVPNSTATAVTFDTKITDRDSGLTATSAYTAQTPGYYLLAAAVTYAANATGARQCYFTVTTGSNNPSGSGITTSFGLASVAGVAGTPAAAASKQLVPQKVYAGDYFQVIAWQNSGGSLSTSTSNAGCWWTIQMVSA